MKDIIGHLVWEQRFTDALKEYREAASDDAKAQAAKKLHDLGLTEGDILYHAGKTPRRST